MAKNEGKPISLHKMAKKKPAVAKAAGVKDKPKQLIWPSVGTVEKLARDHYVLTKTINGYVRP